MSALTRFAKWFGMFGALANALPDLFLRLGGFLLWLVSNTALMVWAYVHEEIDLRDMYAFYTFTSVIGIIFTVGAIYAH